MEPEKFCFPSILNFQKGQWKKNAVEKKQGMLHMMLNDFNHC